MSKLYKNWFVHNVFAHPLSELFYWFVRPSGKQKATAAADWIHNLTLPHNKDEP